MSYINEIDFDFQPGDSFDLSPIEGSYVIGKILALGGELYIDGSTIHVVSIPGKEVSTTTAPAQKEEPVEAEIPATVEEAPAPAPEPEPVPTQPEPEPEPEPELSPAEFLAPIEEAVVESKPEPEPVAAPVAEVKASDKVETPIKRAQTRTRKGPNPIKE